jgi:hypothetical protein
MFQSVLPELRKVSEKYTLLFTLPFQTDFTPTLALTMQKYRTITIDEWDMKRKEQP